MLSILNRLKPLGDADLSHALVKSPFSKLHERKLKIRNETLVKITRQVRSFWAKPNKPMPKIYGMALLSIDSDGYLISVLIDQSSGDFELDQSILDAVHRVQRFDIPINSPETSYYQSLRLSFSSRAEDYEVLPYKEN